MSDEWGPWIEHDGKGCPVPAGTLVHTQDVSRVFPWDKQEWVGMAMTPAAGNVPSGLDWLANDPTGLSYWRVIRYRIRKPRALEQLREIARNPERELEDA